MLVKAYSQYHTGKNMSLAEVNIFLYTQSALFNRKHVPAYQVVELPQGDGGFNELQ